MDAANNTTDTSEASFPKVESTQPRINNEELLGKLSQNEKTTEDLIKTIVASDKKKDKANETNTKLTKNLIKRLDTLTEALEKLTLSVGEKGAPEKSEYDIKKSSILKKYES